MQRSSDTGECSSGDEDLARGPTGAGGDSGIVAGPFSSINMLGAKSELGDMGSMYGPSESHKKSDASLTRLVSLGWGILQVTPPSFALTFIATFE